MENVNNAITLSDLTEEAQNRLFSTIGGEKISDIHFAAFVIPIAYADLSRIEGLYDVIENHVE